MDARTNVALPNCSHQLASTAAIDDVFEEVTFGERRHVRRREWQMLQEVRNLQGGFVYAQRFCRLIWENEAGDPPFVEQILRVHIKLRRLLAGTPWRIVTLWRLSYRLERAW